MAYCLHLGLGGLVSSDHWVEHLQPNFLRQTPRMICFSLLFRFPCVRSQPQSHELRKQMAVYPSPTPLCLTQAVLFSWVLSPLISTLPATNQLTPTRPSQLLFILQSSFSSMNLVSIGQLPQCSRLDKSLLCFRITLLSIIHGKYIFFPVDCRHTQILGLCLLELFLGHSMAYHCTQQEIHKCC